MLISVSEFIGHFHPVMVHLPIGILLIGLLLQVLSSKEKYRISPEVIKIVLLTGMLTAIISCITGYMLSLSGDYAGDLVAWHMWMGIFVALASMLLCVKVIRQQFDYTHKLASFSLFALILITGHLGGSLTHGSDYLTAGWNNHSDSVIVKQKNIPDIQQASAYTDVIQPIFQTKCYNCHGPRRQKGGLRMDDPAALMKGGKDGEVIKPGNADNSELMKRLLLPAMTDHHMPPKEKPQLTDRQIALIHWWIDQNADFIRKVKDLPQNDNIRQALLTLQSNHLEHKAPSSIPVTAVNRADEKALMALKNIGAVVIPVAQGSNYLSANFVTAYTLTDKDVSLLLPVKKQLVWLKLNDTRITDRSLSIISQCRSLTELNLSNTNITDQGIKQLASLDSLQLLNISGTKVTSASLLQLKNLKKLHSIYLYKSSVKPSEISTLQKAFPHVTIDTGNYSVPFLPTDTIILKPPKTVK
ncbi:MAG: c-type cytochrome domain-containing protein [Flavisolibacter sp.]